MNLVIMMESYYKSADNDWFKQRLTGTMLWALAAFAILLLRLIHLQIIEGEEFRRLSKNNCIRLKSLDAPRGLILDCNRNILVDNRPSFDLSIVPKDAHSIEQTLKRLALYLEVPAQELEKKVKRKNGLLSYKPILLKQDIGRNALAMIEAKRFDLPGVVVDVKPRRHYIKQKRAAHLLGYLSEINAKELKKGTFQGSRPGDYIGKFGVEKAYELYLKGKRGGQQVEVNATGQVVRVIKTVHATPGHNIILTINQELQERAEELLEGVAGAVVAMNPLNGEVLIMASSPSFDQNAFVSGMSQKEWNDIIKNPFRPMENKVVQGEYPPASTYKIVTTIASIEEKVVDEKFTVHCPGYYRYGDRIFRCWKRGGHGKVDVIKALAESCDVYFYQAGQKLGIDRLAWYAKACGFNALTGIDLAHEAKGLIPTAAWKRRRTGISWQGGETLSVAIGQGYNLVTPLQMVVFIAAIANGGTLYKPVIMKSIEGGGKVRKGQSEIIGRLPVKKRTLNLIKKGLWNVVQAKGGTGGVVRLRDFHVSGKTGTAQVIGRKINDGNEKLKPDFLKSHAWFVAYAPSNAPKIALAVIIEHGEHGSSAAGPIAREIIRLFIKK